MQASSTRCYSGRRQVCGGPPHHDPERSNHRNGCRHRDLDTRIGTLDMAIPELRKDYY